MYLHLARGRAEGGQMLRNGRTRSELSPSIEGAGELSTSMAGPVFGQGLPEQDLDSGGKSG
eukprot:365447-Chlamydomonas_euryale.AAC.19